MSTWSFFYCGAASITWCLGTMMGMMFIESIRDIHKKQRLLAKFQFKSLRLIFLTCWTISWLFSLLIFQTGKFHLLNMIIGAPLFLVTALSIWQLAKKLPKSPMSPHERKKIFVQFIVGTIALAFLILLQLFSGISNGSYI